MDVSDREIARRLAVACPACGAGIGEQCLNRFSRRPFGAVGQVHETRRRRAADKAVRR